MFRGELEQMGVVGFTDFQKIEVSANVLFLHHFHDGHGVGLIALY